MPAYQSLVKGNKYRMFVDELEDNVSKFETRDKSIMHCHKVALRDENGYIYPAQICTTTTSNGLCVKGDYIEFEISAYTKDVYSLSKISRLSYMKANTFQENGNTVVFKSAGSPQGDVRVVSSQVFQPVGILINPNVSGSAAQSALHEAVYFLSHRPNVPLDNAPEPDDVIELADKFYEWFNSKININTQS